MPKSGTLLRSDGTPLSDDHTEDNFSWSSGSVLLRTQGAQSSCERNVLRDDLSIGIIVFEDQGSEVRWDLEGHTVLQKTWSSTSASHDLLILPPGCEVQTSCRGSGQGLWLFLDPDNITGDKQVESFIERATIDCSWTKDRLAWTIISEIRKECLNGFPRGALFVENAATVFITHLTFILGETAPRFEPTRALNPSKLQMIIEYFEGNLHRNITLSELANLVQLTPRYFCAAFKQAMGRPPHQFQIERRVEKAKTLLHDPNLTIADVALSVGFSSQSHLNDYFRRITGLTPARYRAEVRPKGNAVRHRDL